MAYMKDRYGTSLDKALPSLPAIAQGVTPPASIASLADTVIYNKTDRSWRRAQKALDRAAAGYAPCRIGIYGDSKNQGAGIAPPAYSNATPGLVQAKLNAVAPGGTGTVFFFDNVVGAGAVSPYADTRISLQANGGSLARQLWGPFALSCQQFTNGAGFTITLSGVNELALFLIKGSAGVITATVDGGAPSTYSNTLANGEDGRGAGTGAQSIIRIPASSVGTHTFVVTAPAAASMYVVGVAGYVSGKGFRVSSVARAGLEATNLLISNTTNFLSLETAFAMPSPDISIFDLTVNAYQSQLNLDMVRAQTQALVAKAKQTGDALLVTSTPRNYAEAGYDSTTKPIPLRNYNQIYYDVADRLDCVVLDMESAWGGTYSVGNAAGFYSDGVHWSAAGAKDVANRILKVLDVPFTPYSV